MPLDKIMVAARCSACQLQLCKARGAAPHGGLVEAKREDLEHFERAFVCKTCGITLINSPNTAKPGWVHAR